MTNLHSQKSRLRGFASFASTGWTPLNEGGSVKNVTRDSRPCGVSAKRLAAPPARHVEAGGQDPSLLLRPAQLSRALPEPPGPVAPLRGASAREDLGAHRGAPSRRGPPRHASGAGSGRIRPSGGSGLARQTAQEASPVAAASCSSDEGVERLRAFCWDSANGRMEGDGRGLRVVRGFQSVVGLHRRGM